MSRFDAKPGDTVIIHDPKDDSAIPATVKRVGRDWIYTTVGVFAAEPNAHDRRLERAGCRSMWPSNDARARWEWMRRADRALRDRAAGLVVASFTFDELNAMAKAVPFIEPFGGET